MKKTLRRLFLFGIILGASFLFWSDNPITSDGPPIEFTIQAGSGFKSSMRQIEAAGVPVNPLLMMALAQFKGETARIKAGTYELKPGTTPKRLLEQIVRGEFAQEAVTIIEGWTFRQMRQVIDAHPALKHDTAGLSDAELLAKITTDYKQPEGLFYPDTYLFAKNSSDILVYRQAYRSMIKRLDEQWAKRDPNLPYATPYQALVMASIVEKETGRREERTQIAGVFVNRLRQGMLLQTDPTVIYGMGEAYDGRIRKRDLQTDTPHNTYTRPGLPPTPIALPGAESLFAALNPAPTQALYFVSRGDGSSHFSQTLDEHNNAVNKYIRGR